MEIHAAGGGIHYTVDQTKKGPIDKNYFVQNGFTFSDLNGV